MLSFYEFFCGGGMARAGFGPGWRCLFANDFDPKKAEAYRANWPAAMLHEGDVRRLTAADLPETADLAWASFPCQDLSLAGGGAGLRGERSGAFWPFYQLMSDLREEGRAPKAIALENVAGMLTSRGGRDFLAIAEAFDALGYRFGALLIDARSFVPQSRPRLFFIACAEEIAPPERLLADGPEPRWLSSALLKARRSLPERLADRWVWWRLPEPDERRKRFSELILERPETVRWHRPEETARLLSMMNETNLAKVRRAKRARRRIVGALYKRTRIEDGAKVQRAEVRFDEIAGCLRTPAGGSSRQTILVVHGDSVRSRLLDAREAASLMGLSQGYRLPGNYNDAYHLVGDGVVVDVVRHLARHILEPLALEGEPAEPRQSGRALSRSAA